MAVDNLCGAPPGEGGGANSVAPVSGSLTAAAAQSGADGRSGAAELREREWVQRWASEWELRLSVAHARGKAAGEVVHIGEQKNRRWSDGNGGRRRRPQSGEGGRWRAHGAGIRLSGPWARPSRVVSNWFQQCWPYCSSGSGLVNSFQYSTDYPNIQTKSNL
jgi:hypothetical protein